MRAPSAPASLEHTQHSLREMMAIAAAAASAAAGDAAVASAVAASTETSRQLRMSAARSSYNRRQSISQIPLNLAGEKHKRGAPLPPVQDGARLARINEVAREIALKWVHPRGALQYESDVLHQVRAILYMNRTLITQSFVSHVSGVSQGSLSHYVRGLFKGNQANVEERLGAFVTTFGAGGYDKHLEDARQGNRLVGRPAHYDLPTIEPTPQSAAHPTNSFLRAEPVVDTPPPIPPPPPPQLQPAPWASQPPPTDIPMPSSQPAPQQPQIPVAVPNGAPPIAPHPSLPMTDRDVRAQHRQQKLDSAKRPRSVFPSLPEETEELTPIIAVDRAYHALVAPKWTGEFADEEPLLIPIELFVSQGEQTLHIYTQWDVNERHLSPEFVADRIRRARGLPPEFAKPAAVQIRRALYDAGVMCPPPSDAAEAENRRLLRISVELKEDDSTFVLRDEFEWDLGAGCINSPELFAQLLCADANVSLLHAATIARAVREQVVRAQAIAYGDEDTRKKALEGLPLEDPLRNPLPRIHSSLTKALSPKHRAKDREINRIHIRKYFIIPLVESIPEESVKRKEERARLVAVEKAHKELDILRKRKAKERKGETEKYNRAIKEVDDEARRIHAAGGLDFRPYLQLKVGHGERPSLWMPAAIDRRRRRQLTFPMVHPVKRSSTLGTRSDRSKRRRSSRREERAEARKKARRNNSETVSPVASDGNEVVQGGKRKIFVRIRLRPAASEKVKPRGSERKRRR